MAENVNIVVIGAGAFGTALALSCVKAGASVTLYARRPELAEELNLSQQNQHYLPGIFLSSTLKVVSNLACLQQADIILLATPAQETDGIVSQLKPFLKDDTSMVLCAKGMHLIQKSLLSNVVQRQLNNPLAVLSGPSFADELAQGKPTAVMIASSNIEHAKFLARSLRHSTLRCYATEDVIGVQAAGASKNVMAIASGIVDGLKMGCNSRAALLSRGLAEMSRIGISLGGLPETFMGLAGMGDLILTATSQKSRNYSFGYKLGQGESIDALLSGRHQLTEGFWTTAALFNMTQELNIYAPLTAAVNDILHKGVPISEVIDKILSKQSEQEF
ncbi:NAD(P)H-dependent glycerol-3-phosphate dehydrogenase [Candidatus Odyssella thessalonicensis]|uniref:NAD(P)H-dependent glycerol-3-phosphate dehydrogenase n=1 Tax=Candidatus Odyssella thessalonicensis TaxID=84647 RepID=UPI000225A8F2|nr:NAD(P)H-dependent glycerol-3-phosphate dehydrogenase [Candidatus Odyssella thessalonicensis]